MKRRRRSTIVTCYFSLCPVSNLLFYFCQNFLTTVAILLEAGSYVNAQTLGGETALMKVMPHFPFIFVQNRWGGSLTMFVFRHAKEATLK